jgi:hypothetical protein
MAAAGKKLATLLRAAISLDKLIFYPNSKQS